MTPTDILDDFDFSEPPDWMGEGEVVAKFYSSVEAEIAAARLRSEGIHCFLANAVAQSVTPHIQGIIRLHTRLRDADRAREILEEASIGTETAAQDSKIGKEALAFLAVVIGLLLAWLLVKAI